MRNQFTYIIGAAIVGYLIYSQYTLQNQIKDLSRQNTTLQRRQATPVQSNAKGGQKASVDPYVQNQVKNTIVKNSRSLQLCYNKFIDTLTKESNLKTDGKIHLEWQISDEGIPTEIAKISSEIPSEDLSKCLEKAISTWKFPKPPYKDFYVSHHFTFKKQDSKQAHKN
jgi:hypothetical protein